MSDQQPEAPAVPGVTRWRPKRIVVEAHQWHANGDHPADNCRTVAPDPTSLTQFAPFLSEGEIVRYYRNPDDDGQRECGDCGIRMHDHGWIDQGINGRVVCPGDQVVSLPLQTPGLIAYFPVKPDVFDATCEPAPEPLIMPADEFAATRIVAEALTAVRRGLDLAAPFADDDPRIIAAARQALRVLGGEEADAGPGAAATAPAETTLAEAAYGASAADAEWARTHPAGPAWTRPPLAQVCRLIETERTRAEYWHKRWLAALERADEDGMQIISQHVRIGELERRAEAAEAKLAAIERQCGKATEALRRGTGIPLRQQDVMVDARYILEIIGTGGEAGRG